MKRESRTVDRSHQVDSSTQRHLPLVDLLVDMRAELMELAVASGLKVLTTMLEADRTAICGPRYQHDAEREAVRAGTVPSEVVLGASNREQLQRIDLRWHDLRKAPAGSWPTAWTSGSSSWCSGTRAFSRRLRRMNIEFWTIG